MRVRRAAPALAGALFLLAPVLAETERPQPQSSVSLAQMPRDVTHAIRKQREQRKRAGGEKQEQRDER